MSDGDRPACQYVGSEGAGLESEVEENGGVSCTAEATTVVRPATGSLKDISVPMGKRKVCWEHSRWLISDETGRAWERCGDLATSAPSSTDNEEGGE